METTKTILEWLNEIEEPEIRESAIKECYIAKYSKLSEALLHTLDLVCINEEQEYNSVFWINYINKLKSLGK